MPDMGTGATGEQGASWEQGDRWTDERGASGGRGKGEQGSRGAGEQGSRGKGETGATGATGERGETGSRGRAAEASRRLHSPGVLRRRGRLLGPRNLWRSLPAVVCTEILHLCGFDSVRILSSKGAKSFKLQATPQEFRPQGS